MSWFADLAGKAENLLNNLDEQTGAALRNHNAGKSKKHDQIHHQENPPPGQRKRLLSKSYKKVAQVSPPTETRAPLAPTRRPSPVSNQSRAPRSSSKKSPPRKPSNQINLNSCVQTMVGDVKDSDDDQYGIKERRHSLPTDLELLTDPNMIYKMQNLEVENAMLRNELNVMNHEVSELLDRLRRTEDGNVVVNGSSKELNKSQVKFASSELQYQRLGLEKDSLGHQIDQLRIKIEELTNVEVVRHKEQNQALETEVALLKDRNQELEDKIKQLTEKSSENNAAQIKMDNELRHSQSVISELQANLEKTTEECRRLEKDWETYKLRVKSMLFAKDNEIKALQDGVSMSEDSKALAEQIDALREERDCLTEAVDRARSEYSELKLYADQLAAQHVAAERVVTALREALKDERAAKYRAEAHVAAIGKELKTVEMESGQTIASLRTALRDKDDELTNLRSTASSVQSTGVCALNVADYDVMQEQMENEKIRHLTDTLVQRQNRVDALLRDNNSLRIQLDKLESKYKAEVASKRGQPHTVHVEPRPRARRAAARLAAAARAHPLFRTFLVIYMACLHLWVMTVLFTSTPDAHAVHLVKS